ncbi:MAG: CHAT domain-containing protein [Anaerolineales bacterium]|nr:CHAT domain-containing protein [Anaerolineales bacterium]
MMPTRNMQEMAQFTLRIGKQPSPAAGAPYQVSVLESPMPKIGGAIDSPMSVEEIQYLRAWAERAVQRAQQSPDIAERGGEAEAVISKGQQLYHALPIEVHEALRRSREWARRRKRSLLLGLELDAVPDSAAGGITLADLPWEWLCLPDDDQLGLLSETPIVRVVPRLVENTRLASGPWENVLLVTSTQNNGRPIDVEGISTSLIAAFSSGRVDLCPARIDALQEALQTRPYQMVCFLGHGDLEPVSGQGRLFFEDEAGNSVPLNQAQIAALLTRSISLQLVLLLACQSGRRIARKLVLDGVPAVVAMQFPISERAAGIFLRDFAGALAAGVPVPIATVQGRLALRARGLALEWGTPACYIPRATAQSLPWTEQLEEWIYEILASQKDLFTAEGLLRLKKALLLLLLQRGLWLPWANLPAGPILPAALSLSAGCLVLPLLLTLLTRPPIKEPYLSHFSPPIQRQLRRYQLTGAYLGYIIGLAVDFILLAFPLYYLNISQVLPGTINALTWWIASMIPFLLAYTGLRRISRSVASAYHTPQWSRTDTFILLGVPFIVVPALALNLVFLSPLWLNRQTTPWILGIAGALAMSLIILREKWKGK